MKRNRLRVNGFSLTGALLGIAVAGIVATGGNFLYQDYRQGQAAEGRGRQIGAALTQLEAFAQHYNSALTGASAIAGVAKPYAPTGAELAALGYVAASFADAGQAGGALVYRIASEPAGCEAARCVLMLQVRTSDSVRYAGSVDAAFAHRIAASVPAGAGWSNLPADPSKLARKDMVLNNPDGSKPAIVAAIAWLGNGKASSTVPPPYQETTTSSCPAGYSGKHIKERTVTPDKWGGINYGAWSTKSYTCTPPPPPPDPPLAPNPPAPVIVEDKCSNGATDWPACSAVEGKCQNGATDWPKCTVEEKCSNGATDWPLCTPVIKQCQNGATNWPTCTPVIQVCQNGATNWPVCMLPPVETPISCENARQWFTQDGGRCGVKIFERCSNGTSSLLDTLDGFTDSNGQCVLF